MRDLKILMVDENKEVSKRCKDHLEEQLNDIEICTESRENNIEKNIERNEYSGLIFDYKSDVFDKSRFYEMVKDSNNKLNFILLIDKENKTGSIELTYYTEFKNRNQLKKDLQEGYDLIDAILESDKKGSSKNNRILDLDETVQLLYDKYVKYIFDQTNEEAQRKEEIIEDDMSRVLVHRRLERLKELDLIESSQNKRSYKSNLNDCRISCSDGIISAEFDLNKDIKKIYRCNCAI